MEGRSAGEERLSVTWLSSPLVTPRLLLRPLAAGDEPEIGSLFADAEVRRYLGGALSKRRARGRASVAASGAMDRFWGVFAVVERASDAVIGMVSFDDKRGRWQLSYEFRPAWWGQGLAGEAVTAVLGWFWSQRPSEGEVIAVTQTANARSCRLLERLRAVPVREFEEFGAVQREYVLRRDASVV